MTTTPTAQLPPSAPATVEGLASTVHAGRRGADLSVADLALAASQPRHVVEEAERGDPVTVPQATALLTALGVDPAPWVPAVTSTVVGVDAEHSRRMTYLAETAEGRGDAMLFSDVAPYLASEGYDGGRHAMAVREDESHVPWQQRLFAFTAISGMICGSCGVWTIATAERLATATLDNGFGALALGFVGSFVSLLFWSALSWDTRHTPLRRRLDAAKGHADGMTSQAYAVSARGAVALAISAKGVDASEYLASGMRSVTLVPCGPAHVTVVADTVVGKLEMPWLPRTRDLTDLVASWRARGGEAGRARLEGPQ